MSQLIAVIIEGDRQQYKNHNLAYFVNPGKEICRSLQTLKDNKVWQGYWDDFMLDMVFGEKPAFSEVLDSFIHKSEKILRSLAGLLPELQPA